ncbi:hypothetical protein BFJ63_vAg17694 [Fusarium oxysporum f. sp. narcissi]|uniref:Amidohydrolase 3 domain-containing protein n=1 Tax=Fusarium oxysporum f. sp. narcissi TaxID=451672 RepID=A0A4Q2UZ86_FUSOX|nr:hypothetical protein BFJ63_vAg17694 [Fusarium oxysporum f. sp. narcissi]
MVVDLSGKTAVNVAYINGVVLPSATAPSAQAILIQDGLVVAVGTNEEVLKARGPDVEVQDIKGAVLAPGLIDTHPHLIHFAAARAPLVNLLDVKSHEEVIEAIAKRAATLPKGEWIPASPIGDPQYFVKRSYRDLKGGMPDRHVLDKASTDHPMLLILRSSAG